MDHSDLHKVEHSCSRATAYVLTAVSQMQKPSKYL